MKKTRFLCIRNLPDGCKGAEIRKVFERFGDVQALRIFKDTHLRHAVIAFADITSAIRAGNTGIKLSDTVVKTEYCDSLDPSDIFNKVHLPFERISKVHSTKSESGMPLKYDVSVFPRSPSASRCMNGRSPTERHHSSQTVRPTSISPYPSLAWRGIKILKLPAQQKLSEPLLRQGLFKELHCFGDILSVDLCPNLSGRPESPRAAVVTFQRPEDARHCYHTLSRSSKLLFSAPICVEPHLGVPDATTVSDSRTRKSPERIPTSSPTLPSRSLAANPASVPDVVHTPSKCPTRTLWVGGLTTGPTGPVTTEQLTTAFRKFGEIIDVQLQPSSSAALIQFTEVRGPSRAMNAHSRDPLRLGGRPLNLAYVPSRPCNRLWFHELPSALSSLSDEALFRKLTELAPIQEITLITRLQPGQTAPSTSTNSQRAPHYAACIRCASVQHATSLLTELHRRGHFQDSSDSPTDASSTGRQRRMITVDFASSRQIDLVRRLCSNANTGGLARSRTISLASINRNKGDKTSRSGEQLFDNASSLKGSKPSSGFNSSRTTQDSTLSNFVASADRRPMQQSTDLSKSPRVHEDPPFLPTIRSRDTSPSSMSTTSTSSLSSESSSSSTSSSTSSVSSCTSSGSSTNSKSHRPTDKQTFRSKPNRMKSSTAPPVPLTPPDAVNSCAQKSSAPSTVTSDGTPNRISAESVTSRRSFPSTSVQRSSPAVAATCVAGDAVGLSTSPTNSTAARFAANSDAKSHSKVPANLTSPDIHRRTSGLQQFSSSGNGKVSAASHNTPFSGSSGCHSSYSNSGSDCSPFSVSQRVGCPTSQGGRSKTSGPPSKRPFIKSRASPTDENKSQISRRLSHPSPSEAKSRVYSSEASSGLKLHLSASCPSSVSPSNFPNPFTVSIKLSSQPSPSPTSVLTSPSGTGYCEDTVKHSIVSSPLTPMSAPPLRGPSRNRLLSGSDDKSTEDSLNHGSSDAGPHSADWLNVGSPVYESMYDKIKRRTNSEAEKRRQRQLEALNAKDKRRRRKQESESLRLCKSSFRESSHNSMHNREHNTKRSSLSSSVAKLHRSKSEHSKSNKVISSSKNRQKNARILKDKPFPANNATAWHIKDSRDNDSSLSSLSSRFSHKSRRASRNLSPASSLTSADECDSSSPPEMLTRLSLGMRFPVSATYHECIRPPSKVHSKRSNDEESLSRFSSVSCSESEGSHHRSRKKSTNRSDASSKREQNNGLHSRSHNEKTTDNPKSMNLSYPKTYSTHKTNGLTNFSDKVTQKNHLRSTENMKPEPNTLDSKVLYGKKRHRENVYTYATDHKRQRMHVFSALTEQKDRSAYNATHDKSDPFYSLDSRYQDYGLNSSRNDCKKVDNDLQASMLEAFTSIHWPRTQRKRLISGSLHSVTDDSSQTATRSPSPISTRFLGKSSTKCSVRSDSTGHVDDDRDSVFGSFRDSDHLSSKSTPSTEPMEQEDYIERDCFMKFSEDDWHSSVVSTSPHPATLDFEADYGPVDKTEQSSTTYQSTSFSSQMLSPLGKLPSSNAGESDEDDMQLQQISKLTSEPVDREQQSTSSFGSPPLQTSCDEFSTQRSPVSETKAGSLSPNTFPSCSLPDSHLGVLKADEPTTTEPNIKCPAQSATIADALVTIPAAMTEQKSNIITSPTDLNSSLGFNMASTHSTGEKVVPDPQIPASLSGPIPSAVSTTFTEVVVTLGCSKPSSSVSSISSSWDASKPISLPVSSVMKSHTDTHDITRYVQSVIERVKAEKVEETQQAASAFSHPVCTSSTVTSSVVSQSTRQDIPSSIGMNSPLTFKRQMSASQRKPLLLATSTCPVTKAGITTTTKSSIPISTVVPPLAASPHESNTTNNESLTTTRPSISSTLPLSTDVQMPLIPGVNACDPLAVSLSSATTRMTRQSSVPQSPPAAKRLDPSTAAVSPVVHTAPVTASPGIQTRRRRRSDGKSKESTQSIVSSALSTSTNAQVSSVPASKVSSGASIVITSTHSVSNIAVSTSSTTSKSFASIDPYEPNFDESPPGFSHSQLHPHRIASPRDSPISQAPCSTNLRKSPLTSPSANSVSKPVAVDPHPSRVDHVDVVKSEATPLGSATPITDSVDEVIRDVCAGQFDVQSYLNNWRSEQAGKTTGSPHPVNMNQSDPIVTIANSSAPRSVNVPTAVTGTKPFPLSLTSEPVVAAVTIPVSSGTAVNKPSNGQSWSNNPVNIATGNALLNTLLAALQRIPGSQVTVTGPAAAGVVGAIGTGAISATTITLPVNAAVQAAANIKAVMLSATGAAGANVADSTERVPAESKTVASTVEPNKSTTPGSLVLESTSNTKSSISHPSHTPSLSQGKLNANPTPITLDSNLKSNTKVSQLQQISPAPTKLSAGYMNAPTNLLVDTVKPSSCLTEPSLLLPFRSSKDAVDATATSRPPSHSFGTHVRSSATIPNAHLFKANNPLQSLNPSIISSYAIPPHLQTGPTQSRTFRSVGRPTSNLTPSRSPPAPSVSQTIQALAERLGGAVEPSVLLALVQATASGSLGADATGRSETENQVFTYLRRLAAQFNDTLPLGRQPTNVAEVPQAHNSLSPTSPALATSHLNQHHQRFPPVTCPLYVNAMGAESSSIHPRSNSEVNCSISPSLLSPRTFTTHASSNVLSTAANHLSWSSLGQAYPLVWQGRLSLKNAETRVALHYVYGNRSVLHDCMALLASGGGGQSLISTGGPLRIVQRMRLEISQLEGVQRKIQQDGASCVCLALPAGNNHVELVQQTQILNDSFIRYMQEKTAAGIINVGLPEFQQGLYVVHIFPPCDFSHAQLSIAAPELHCRVVQTNQSHLLVVVTTV